MARIATVIVNFRTPALALDAVRALAAERAACPGLTAVIVDGGSGDGSAGAIATGLRDPALAGWARLLALPINGGFGWGNNQAIQRLLQSDEPPAYVHLLNPDTRVEPGALAALAATLDAHPRCGAVGSLLLEPDGSPSGSAFAFPSLRSELQRGIRLGLVARALRTPPLVFSDDVAREVGWATGASVMLRAAALKESGLFDTGFFLYFEEVELMWRMTRAGWSIRYCPASRVTHVGGAATGVNGSRPTATRPALPPYWYASRRRFLALTGGRARAAALSGAWAAGHLLFVLRRLAGSGRQHALVERDFRNFRRAGMLPGAADRTPAIARWDDPVDRPPAWMNRASVAAT